MDRGFIRSILTALAACLAMTLAVLVRMPPAFSVKGLKHADSYIDKEGLPYLIQPDAYYHVRMGDEIIEKGYFGTLPDQTGNASDERTDMLSFAPEGHPAVHQDGIVRMAILVWRAVNLLPGMDISLHTIEYYLSCLLAALTALAVFLFGRRLSNTAGGLFAAVYAVCALAFAVRTAAGTFDTDMVQPFFTVLMIFLIMEAICAPTIRYAIIMALGVVISAEAYVQCWGSNALAFVLIMFAGGGAALLLLLLENRKVRRKECSRLLKIPGLIGYAFTLIMMAVALLALHGSSLFDIFLNTFQRVESVAGGTEAAVMPDLFLTISELKTAPFGLGIISLLPWTEPGVNTVIGGLGGILVLLLALAGMGSLFVRAFLNHRKISASADAKPDASPAGAGPEGNCVQDCRGVLDKSQMPEKIQANSKLTGLVMLVVWLASCLYMVRLGSRFVEHLAIPVGILAGCVAGELVSLLINLFRKRKENSEGRNFSTHILPLTGSAAGMLLCIAAASFSAYGAWKCCETLVPSTCDAHESAMDWVAENAKTPDAIIASWWDQGFFYEYESGHPVLWDGVTQDSARAIMLGKALITDNKYQSRNLLHMLAGSGNTLFKELRKEYGPRIAFNALCAAAAAGREGARQCFREEWSIPDDDAERFAGLLFPEETREIYLVLSTGMMMRLGYIEYYADWDFTGDQPLPVSSTYYSRPDGFGRIDLGEDSVRNEDTLTEEAPDAAEGTDPIAERRKKETIWQLFFDRDGVYEDQVQFERVYEAVDGVEQVQVWRVIP